MISILKVTARDAESIFDMASQLAMSFDVAGKHDVRDFERTLRDDNVIFLIARFDNNVVGYLYGNMHYAFYAAQNVAWIEELFVKNAHRKKGIATALIKQAELIASEHKSALISVATRRAELFYEKVGYERSAHYFRKLLE